MRMYLWWSFCTLYLLTCQVTVLQVIQVSVVVSLVICMTNVECYCFPSIVDFRGQSHLTVSVDHNF